MLTPDQRAAVRAILFIAGFAAVVLIAHISPDPVPF